MLELNDFFDDQLLLRQVKRAQRRAALDMEEDDDVAESRRRGAGPEEIGEGDSILPEQRRQTIVNVKRERQSRGPSMATSHHGAPLSGGKEEEDEEEDATGMLGSEA
jgi:hypothetical protein